MRTTTENANNCKREANNAYTRATAEIKNLQAKLDDLLVQAERNHQLNKADWTVIGSLVHYAEVLESLELSV